MIDSVLFGHERTANRLIKIQIIRRMFSDHNGTKLEINNKKDKQHSSKSQRKPEIRKFSTLSNNTGYQNVWKAAQG